MGGDKNGIRISLINKMDIEIISKTNSWGQVGPNNIRIWSSYSNWEKKIQTVEIEQ